MNLKLNVFKYVKKLHKTSLEDNYGRKEAVIAFIVWNRLKEKSLRKKVIDMPSVKKEINQLKNLLRKDDIHTLLKEFSKYCSKDSQLPNMFRKLKWRKYLINTDSIGVITPKLGDLPRHALVGNLRYTAGFVKNHKRFRSYVRIKKLAKLCSLLDKVPPIIIDSSYHNQRKKLPSAEDTKYYIEDGNNRAIAYTLYKNKYKLMAFVGSIE